MAELAQAIRQVNEREIDANEAAIAGCFPQPPQVPAEAQLHLVPFLQWCHAQRVRSLPARPTSVAAFVQWQTDLKVPKEQIGATLSAIEALHNVAALGNPIATPVVRITTAASTISPPRSWTRAEQDAFRELPVELQRTVSRREKDREVQLRRLQNEAAELRRQMADAAPKTADNTERETTNGKEVKTGDGRGSVQL
jgi:hypothetical protein